MRAEQGATVNMTSKKDQKKKKKVVHQLCGNVPSHRNPNHQRNICCLIHQHNSFVRYLRYISIIKIIQINIKQTWGKTVFSIFNK